MLNENRIIRHYHICTEGTGNGIVYSKDEDYKEAIKISAVAAYVCNVKIICYCHMSSHSHFVIIAQKDEDAIRFGDLFKRKYGIYARKRNNVWSVYRNVDSSPILIKDIYYLKNCIAYVLLNPVAAGIVKSPEQYSWSSFHCYFESVGHSGRPISTFTKRAIKNDILKTHHDMSRTGFLIGEENCVLPSSFVEYKYVEKLFGNHMNFYRTLVKTKSDEEEARYIGRIVRYSDNEALSEVILFAQRYYHVNRVNELTKEQKYKSARFVQAKTGISNKRIARILNLRKEEIDHILEDLTKES